MSPEDLDLAIISVLPPGCEVISVAKHGKTNWSTGFRIATKKDGETKEYFIKILEREDAAKMAEGEYESQNALMGYIPDSIVHPIAWGTFRKDNSKAFFLTSFRNLQARSPSIEQLLPILKTLHTHSSSPNGKFGFHVTTFYGAPPMTTDWTDTWEEFFARELRSNLEYALQNRGDDPNMRIVADEFFAKVIPRLMRPLQTNGRSIRPTLCHGDLWDGNIQIDLDTKQPVIFDACCFYGHNEMDLQCMRDPRYAIGLEFVERYKQEVGMSEPQDDFDNRIAVYSMRNDILTAGMWPHWAPLLLRVKEEMIRLLAEYPDGLAGFKDPRREAFEGIASAFEES